MSDNKLLREGLFCVIYRICIVTYVHTQIHVYIHIYIYTYKILYIHIHTILYQSSLGPSWLVGWVCRVDRLDETLGFCFKLSFRDLRSCSAKSYFGCKVPRNVSYDSNRTQITIS